MTASRWATPQAAPPARWLLARSAHSVQVVLLFADLMASCWPPPQAALPNWWLLTCLAQSPTDRVAVCFAGASGRPHAGHPHRQHCLLGGSRWFHGAPKCASHPLHTSLRALTVLQVGTVLWCQRALPFCISNPLCASCGCCACRADHFNTQLWPKLQPACWLHCPGFGMSCMFSCRLS